jgi:hypothetical protein
MSSRDKDSTTAESHIIDLCLTRGGLLVDEIDLSAR